jgi:hypothetical protein
VAVGDRNYPSTVDHPDLAGLRYNLTSERIGSMQDLEGLAE